MTAKVVKPGNWILPTYADTDCWKDYEPGKILGKGTFGTTYAAKNKKTGEDVAIKVISKKKLVSAEEIGDVQREVQIMHHLAGHANVVCLKVRGLACMGGGRGARGVKEQVLECWWDGWWARCPEGVGTRLL